MRGANKVVYFLAGVFLVSALVNDKQFESPSMAAYFFFLIAGGIIMIFASWTWLTQPAPLQIGNILPLVLFTLINLYYLVQAISVSNMAWSPMLIYLVVCNCLIIAFTLLLKLTRVRLSHLFNVIIIIAIIESFICIGQFIDVVKSSSNFFTVTGSWVNPNVTALFLSLSIAAALSNFYDRQNALPKTYYLIAAAIIIVALVLLKCRTAFIGVLIIGSIILNQRYNLIERINKKYTGLKILIPIFLFAVTLAILSVGFYYMKPASSDGRMLIWKIGVNMVRQKPLTGFGYDRFDVNYNLAQANYFQEPSRADHEIKNAAYTRMAYNEFLQAAVEGGVIGLVLILSLFLSLLIPFPKYNLHVTSAYAGVFAFAVMSMVNFTIQAVPAMAMFIIYSSILCAAAEFKPVHIFAWARYPITIILTAIGLFISVSQTKQASSSIKSKQAYLLSQAGKNDPAIRNFKSLENSLTMSELYWSNYGFALFKEKKYSEALEKFKRAASLKSKPGTYLQMAMCYQKLGNSDSAIICNTFAKNMEPCRLMPVFSMMMLYRDKNDINNMVSMAKEIMTMPVKVRSRETDLFKMAANKVLKDNYRVQ